MDAPRRPWCRKKWWLAAGLLWLAVAYPTSFHPAAYVTGRAGLPLDVLMGIYHPIVVCTSGRPIASEPAIAGAYRESVKRLHRLGKRHHHAAEPAAAAARVIR